MKEILERIELPKTTDTPKRIWPIAKCWKQVKAGTHPNKLHEHIRFKMSAYQFVLNKVKERYLMPGEVYFDRDYTDDKSNPFIIYTFISNTFYWYIECTLNHEIIIRYDFNSCIYEQQIRELFRQYSLTHYITRTPKNLTEYLKRVIAYQDPKYIHNKT